jgi:hypothetical protein
VLLPPMRADLGWSYARPGCSTPANAAGYLAGALACPLLVARVGHAATLRLCAGLTAANLLSGGIDLPGSSVARMRRRRWCVLFPHPRGMGTLGAG